MKEKDCFSEGKRRLDTSGSRGHGNKEVSWTPNDLESGFRAPEGIGSEAIWGRFRRETNLQKGSCSRPFEHVSEEDEDNYRN